MVPILALMIPITITAIVAFMVVRLAELRQSGRTDKQTEERLARLEQTVEELREMVYDAVVERHEGDRYAELDSRRVSVDA